MRAGARPAVRVAPGEPLVAQVVTVDQSPVVGGANGGLGPLQLPLAGLTEDMFKKRVADTQFNGTTTFVGPLGLSARTINQTVGPALVSVVWPAAGPMTVRKGQWLPLYQPEYANTPLGFVCEFNNLEPGILKGEWLVEWERRAATNIIAGFTASRHTNRARWTEFGVFVNGVLAGRSGLLYPRYHTLSLPFVGPLGAGYVRCELRMLADFGFVADAVGAAASTVGTRPPINIWRSIGTARVKWR